MRYPSPQLLPLASPPYHIPPLRAWSYPWNAESGGEFSVGSFESSQLCQSSRASCGTRENSPVLWVTSTAPSRSAWAAIIRS